MFSSESFEDSFSTDYMPLKYDILTQLFYTITNRSKQMLIHVKDLCSSGNKNPSIWVKSASDKPSFYFNLDELPPRSKKLLREIFGLKSVKKIFFNATHELPYLKSIDLPVSGKIFDILTIDKLLKNRKFLDQQELDVLIKFHLFDYYYDLPSLKTAKYDLIEDHVRNFAMCLNLLFPLRKKLINDLEDKDLMKEAKAELVKFR